jgi:hypothetical protein
MSWIHLLDEIRAISFLLETPEVAGPVNLSAPSAVRMREFSLVLGDVLHRPSWMAVPGFILRAMLGEMSDVVLTGQRVVPQKLRKTGFEFRYPVLKEALGDLLRNSGMRAVSTTGHES